MIPLNIPLLLVGAFVLLTLVVGLYFSNKTTTLREYAVGNKQFTTATLVATVLATGFGGAGFARGVEQIHNRGLYWISLALLSFSSILITKPLMLRIAPFMQHLSIAETISSAYGKYPRIITALSCICTSIVIVSSQINVMAMAIGMCIGLEDPQYINITIGATSILIFYSTCGGIRAVTFTDVLQFLTFSIIIPFLAWFMFQNIGKPVSEIISFLQHQEKFQFKQTFHFDTHLVAILMLFLSNLLASIDPETIQRMYMSSGPIQAQRVLLYSSFFTFIIDFSIILVGLFVFVAAPELPIEEVWGYIMAHIPPVFKGFVSIGLLAMTMSTADSCLNTCAVIVSHDIVEGFSRVKLPYTHSLRLVRWVTNILGLLGKAITYFHPLQLAKITTVIVGLSAMLLAFKYKKLLDIMLLAFDLYIPIVIAPFILAVFSFRGTSRTALVGMSTGIFSILAWNKWIAPATDINGAFPCMIANGLAMMAAHYLLPHTTGSGWIGPDDELRQVRQANARKKARRKEQLKFTAIQSSLAKLKPNTTKLMWVGIYIIVTTLLSFFTIDDMDLIYWPILQLVAGTCFVGYVAFFEKEFPDWIMGRNWLIGVIFCLPVNVLWYLFHIIHPLFTLNLPFVHLAVTLWILPLYLGLGIVVATLSIAIYLICSTGIPVLWPSASGLGIVMFAIIIYYKRKMAAYTNEIHYLKNQAKLKQDKKLKNIAYNLHIGPSTIGNDLAEDSAILEKVVKDVTQSISFLDATPLYKQDFQSIINKFSEWTMFLKKQIKSKDHILLLPSEITLDALISRLEIALAREMGRIPRLFIEKKDNAISEKIICDINQTLYLLVMAILRIADLDRLEAQFIKIQMGTTQLQYEKSDPDHDGYLSTMTFPAIAMVISNASTPPTERPQIQSYYKGRTDHKGLKRKSSQLDSEQIDLGKKTIKRIIHAHYGYLEIPNQSAMLLVLPWNVTTIRDEMIAKLPIAECLL